MKTLDRPTIFIVMLFLLQQFQCEEWKEATLEVKQNQLFSTGSKFLNFQQKESPSYDDMPFQMTMNQAMSGTNYMMALGILGFLQTIQSYQFSLRVYGQIISQSQFNIKIQSQNELESNLKKLHVSFIVIDQKLKGVSIVMEEGLISPDKQIEMREGPNTDQPFEEKTIPILSDRLVPNQVKDVKIRIILSGYNIQNKHNQNVFSIRVLHKPTQFNKYQIYLRTFTKSYSLFYSNVSFTTIFYSERAARIQGLKIIQSTYQIRPSQNKQSIDTNFTKQTMFLSMYKFQINGQKEDSKDFSLAIDQSSHEITFFNGSKFVVFGLRYFIFHTYTCNDTEYPLLNAENSQDIFCHKKCDQKQFFDPQTKKCQNCSYDCEACNSTTSCFKCDRENSFREQKWNEEGTQMRCVPIQGYYSQIDQYVAKQCPSSSQCGDGNVFFQQLCESSNEECDDNNTQDNDGCSSDCKIQRGYQCKTQDENGEAQVSVNSGKYEKQTIFQEPVGVNKLDFYNQEALTKGSIQQGVNFQEKNMNIKGNSITNNIYGKDIEGDNEQKDNSIDGTIEEKKRPDVENSTDRQGSGTDAQNPTDDQELKTVAQNPIKVKSFGLQDNQNSGAEISSKSFCFYTSKLDWNFSNLTKTLNQNSFSFVLTISTLNLYVLKSFNWTSGLEHNIPKGNLLLQSLSTNPQVTGNASLGLNSIKLTFTMVYNQQIAKQENISLSFNPGNVELIDPTSFISENIFSDLQSTQTIYSLIDSSNMKIQYFDKSQYMLAQITGYLFMTLSVAALLMILLSIIGVKIIAAQILLVLQCTYYSMISFTGNGGIPSVKAMSFLSMSAWIYPFEYGKVDKYGWLELSQNFINNSLVALGILMFPYFVYIICSIISICLKKNEKPEQLFQLIKTHCIYEIPLFLYLIIGFNLTISLGIAVSQYIAESETERDALSLSVALGSIFLVVGILISLQYLYNKQIYAQMWKSFSKSQISEKWVIFQILYIWANSAVIVAMKQYWFSNLVTVSLNIALIVFLKVVSPFSREIQNRRSLIILVLNISVQLLIMTQKLCIDMLSEGNSTNVVASYIPLLILILLFGGVIYSAYYFVKGIKQKCQDTKYYLNEEPAKSRDKKDSEANKPKDYDFQTIEGRLQYLQAQSNLNRQNQNRNIFFGVGGSLSKERIQKEFNKIGSTNTKRLKNVRKQIKSQLLQQPQCKKNIQSLEQNAQRNLQTNETQFYNNNLTAFDYLDQNTSIQKPEVYDRPQQNSELEQFWNGYFDPVKSTRNPRTVIYFDQFKRI